jgi:hypothetical protein
VTREELAETLTTERFTHHIRTDNRPIPHLPLPPVDTAVDNELVEAS